MKSCTYREYLRQVFRDGATRTEKFEETNEDFEFLFNRALQTCTDEDMEVHIRVRFENSKEFASCDRDLLDAAKKLTERPLTVNYDDVMKTVDFVCREGEYEREKQLRNSFGERMKIPLELMMSCLAFMEFLNEEKQMTVMSLWLKKDGVKEYINFMSTGVPDTGAVVGYNLHGTEEANECLCTVEDAVERKNNACEKSYFGLYCDVTSPTGYCSTKMLSSVIEKAKKTVVPKFVVIENKNFLVLKFATTTEVNALISFYNQMIAKRSTGERLESQSNSTSRAKESPSSWNDQRAYSSRDYHAYTPRDQRAYSSNDQRAYSSRDYHAYTPRDQRAYSSNEKDAYSSRDHHAYTPRDQRAYSSNEKDAYSSRDHHAYTPRDQRAYSSNEKDAYSSRDHHAYTPRDQRAYSSNEKDAYSSRDHHAYTPRDQRAYSSNEKDAYSSRDYHAYTPRDQRAYSSNEKYAYSSRDHHAYTPRDQRAYSSNEQDAYSPRDQRTYKQWEYRHAAYAPQSSFHETNWYAPWRDMKDDNRYNPHSQN